MKKRRINVITKASIQPFRIASNLILGDFSVKKVYPRSVSERNKPIYSYNNRF